MGAVLFQDRDDGDRQIILYASCCLSAVEHKYHSNEQEASEITWAIKRYRVCLEEREFTLVTDNKGLIWLQQAKDQRAKLTRWAILFSEFSFTITHCQGKNNQQPYALSRNRNRQKT
jgi:hypothetical protein